MDWIVPTNRILRDVAMGVGMVVLTVVLAYIIAMLDTPPKDPQP